MCIIVPVKSLDKLSYWNVQTDGHYCVKNTWTE